MHEASPHWLPCSRGQSTPSVCVILVLSIFLLPCLVEGWLGCTRTLKIQAQRGIRQAQIQHRLKFCSTFKLC